ncbi:11399_t:CDS:2, partial [Entrophospora sp. SA101]
LLVEPIQIVTPVSTLHHSPIGFGATDVSLLNRDEISSSIKKKGGRRLDDIWEYVNKGESLGGGHYKASCKWCGGGWTRGRPQDMKVHLARNL